MSVSIPKSFPVKQPYSIVLKNDRHTVISSQNRAASFFSTLIEKVKDLWNKMVFFICSCFCKKPSKKPGSIESQVLNVSHPKEPVITKKPIPTISGPGQRTLPKLTYPPAPLIIDKPEEKKSLQEKKPDLIDDRTPNRALSPPPTSDHKIAFSAPSTKPRLPQAISQQIFTYLTPKEVAIFSRTCRANREDANSKLVWTRLIRKHFPHEIIPEACNPKELFKSLASTRMESVTIPNGPSVHITFLKGVTTVGELKAQLSQKTNIPVDKIRIELITRTYLPELIGWRELGHDQRLVSDFLTDYTNADGTAHVLYPETRLKCSRIK